MKKGLSIAVIGLGYFSQFHLKAWQSLDGAGRISATDLDPKQCSWAQREFNVSVYDDLETLLHAEKPDVVDIVAPPPAHLALIRESAREGRTLICQKPFCTSFDQATHAVTLAESAKARLIIHENFRFQPWHRTIKTALEDDRLGQIYQCRFALRPGDGQGHDAYLARQPGFRDMPRFLVQETGVHFVDLFRWLFGEIENVYADLRQLNPAIRGEDAGHFVCNHTNGVQSIFDGNRLVDHKTDNPRRTMGEMTIEGSKGTLTLDGAGDVWLREHGATRSQHLLHQGIIDDSSFGGGCVRALHAHILAALQSGAEFENQARDYLPVLEICDAIYQSAEIGQKVRLKTP